MRFKVLLLLSLLFIITGCSEEKQENNIINTEPIIIEKEVFESEWENVDEQVNKEVLDYFYRATEKNNLDELVPERIIGIQEIGGTGYQILCSTKSDKKIVSLFIDLDGEAIITDIKEYQ